MSAFNRNANAMKQDLVHVPAGSPSPIVKTVALSVGHAIDAHLRAAAAVVRGIAQEVRAVQADPDIKLMAENVAAAATALTEAEAELAAANLGKGLPRKAMSRLGRLVAADAASGTAGAEGKRRRAKKVAP